ncbi:MAG: hypothetical protein P9L92_15475 [Candidatus Electryonea clarkiae]|nr:hypothetical protein [Candidatus Electryonea clarkiae]
MSAKSLSLIEGNVHLHDSAKREKAIVNFVYGVNKLEGVKTTLNSTRENYRKATENRIIRSKSRVLKGH